MVRGSISGTLPTGAAGAASSSSTGWDTFTNSRWIWLITIIVALGSVVMVATERKLEMPVQLGAIVTGLGALSTLLIFYRIVHHPSDSVSFGGLHASYGIKIGIWLGLIAAAVITYGGYLQMQQESAMPAGVPERGGDAFSGVTVAGAGASSTGSTAATASTATPPSPPPAATPPAPLRLGLGPTRSASTASSRASLVTPGYTSRGASSRPCRVGAVTTRRHAAGARRKRRGAAHVFGRLSIALRGVASAP